MNLIVPVACGKTRKDILKNTREGGLITEIDTYRHPYSHLGVHFGFKVMCCIWSILSFRPSQFNKIYFVFNKDIEEGYRINEYITRTLKVLFDNKYDDKFECVMLENPTASEAETIATAIQQANITGAICIKDADNLCSFDDKIPVTNGIFVYDIEKQNTLEINHTSFVSLDLNGLVDNVMEHKVVGNYMNCGGYVFESADEFVKVYNDIIEDIEPMHKSKVYMSNIIYHMLLQGKIFMPIYVTGYFTE